jgi:hypothetical protein
VGSTRGIEQAGFDSAWFFDAIGRGFMRRILIGAAVAAAATTRIEIGTGVLQVPLRNPVELAHRILTAHRRRGGSCSGWAPAPPGRLRGARPHHQRMRTLEVARDDVKLWRGEKVGAADLTRGRRLRALVLIGSWKGERWIRGPREFDGWIASGAKTSLQALTEGIGRYRAAGGKRAIVTNIAVDLAAPTEPLPDGAPFHLRCAPDAAARRLQQVRELGFDDAILVLKTPTEAGLAAARALLG